MPSTSTPSPLHLVHALAASGSGFVTAAQLDQVGVASSSLSSAVERSRLHRVLRGVYHAYKERDQLERPEWVHARVLAFGAEAVLGGTAALELYGFTRFRHSDARPVTVLTPTWSRRQVPGARGRLDSRLDLADVRVVSGVRVPPIEHLITTLGTDLTKFQLANVVHQALYHQRRLGFSVRRLVRCAQEASCPGIGVVRDALRLHLAGSAGTRSFTEDRYVAGVIGRLGREPHVNVVVRVAGYSYEIDVGFLPERVRIELDGGQHGRRFDAARDTASDRRFTDDGWRVLRESDDAVRHQLDECLDRLAAALEVAW